MKHIPVALLLVITFSVGLNGQRGGSQSSVGDDGRAKFEIDEKCSNAAERLWRMREYDKRASLNKALQNSSHITPVEPLPTLTFTNHYNRELRVCLIKIEEFTFIAEPILSTTTHTIIDALEGALIAARTVKVRANTKDDVEFTWGDRVPFEHRNAGWFNGLMVR